MVTASLVITVNIDDLIDTMIKTPHCSCSWQMIESISMGSVWITIPMAGRCLVVAYDYVCVCWLQSSS